MPKGGVRPGSGRKPGSRNQKTRAVAVEAAKLGISPVEVLLDVMRRAHAEGNDAVALDAATRAGPYCHAKLSAIQIDLGDIDEAELRRMAG